MLELFNEDNSQTFSENKTSGGSPIVLFMKLMQ
jgi:hypothetical protein